MIARTARAVVVAVGLVLLAAGGPEVTLGAAPEPAETPSREYLIKAAFLYNFAKFTEWPEGTFAEDTDTLNICVLGEDPFGGALQSIENKPVRGRPVAVRRVSDVQGGLACHLLFISESEEPRLPAILRALGNRPILTIADIPDFARAGGIIRLKTNLQDQVRFEINLGIAKRAGLRLSSRLLGLAEITPY